MIKQKILLWFVSIAIILNDEVVAAIKINPIDNHLEDGLNDSQENIYVSEFEIIEMNNHDGRLQSGLCCDGTKPLQKFGCKNGNKTCKPYWRICIDEIEPDYVPSVTNRINQEAIISKNREQRWISNTLIPNGQLIPLNLSNIFIRNSQRQSIPSIGELRNGSKKISTIQNFFSK